MSKMTKEEVIKIVKENAVPVFPLQIEYQDWLTAMGMVTEALEKQIPKKPMYTNEGTVTRCPVCEAIHFHCLPSLEVDYCERCGQAIDWSEEI